MQALCAHFLVSAMIFFRCGKLALRYRKRAIRIRQMRALRGDKVRQLLTSLRNCHTVREKRCRMIRTQRVATAAIAAICLVCDSTCAAEAGWLQVRDQNPFALGAGIPLLPEGPLQANEWHLDAYVAESNSQLPSSDAHTRVIYDAETRESRIAFAYAFDDEWSARVSLGALWIGAGFLDRPIEHFHDWIGAPRGYRGGRLGVRAPYVRVDHDGATLFLLDNSHQGAAPLLADVTRTWSVSDETHLGIGASAAIPLGDARHLDDLGATSFALSAFGDWHVNDSLQAGARIGFLHLGGNDVLPSLARSNVPFGDVYARAPLWGGWHAALQYGLHGALYRDAPNFLDYAGVLSAGLTHALGARAQLQLAISEDVPILHTQDVVLSAALRVRSK